MIEKPDPSDFELWKRSPCTKWLYEQLYARFDQRENWQRARTFDEIQRYKGHQEISDFIQAET